jgi:hypothetical protein
MIALGSCRSFLGAGTLIESVFSVGLGLFRGDIIPSVLRTFIVM